MCTPGYTLSELLGVFREVEMPGDFKVADYKEIISTRPQIPVLRTEVPELDRNRAANFAAGKNATGNWRSRPNKKKKGSNRNATGGTIGNITLGTSGNGANSGNMSMNGIGNDLGPGRKNLGGNNGPNIIPPAKLDSMLKGSKKQDDEAWDITSDFNIQTGSSIPVVKFPGVSDGSKSNILDPFGAGNMMGPRDMSASSGRQDQPMRLDPFGANHFAPDAGIGGSQNNNTNNSGSSIPPGIPSPMHLQQHLAPQSQTQSQKQQQQAPPQPQPQPHGTVGMPPQGLVMGPGNNVLPQFPGSINPMGLQMRQELFTGNGQIPMDRNMPMQGMPPVGFRMYPNPTIGFPGFGMPQGINPPGIEFGENLKIKIPVGTFDGKNQQMQPVQDAMDVNAIWGHYHGMSITELQDSAKRPIDGNMKNNGNNMIPNMGAIVNPALGNNLNPHINPVDFQNNMDPQLGRFGPSITVRPPALLTHQASQQQQQSVPHNMNSLGRNDMFKMPAPDLNGPGNKMMISQGTFEISAPDMTNYSADLKKKNTIQNDNSIKDNSMAVSQMNTNNVNFSQNEQVIKSSSSSSGVQQQASSNKNEQQNNGNNNDSSVKQKGQTNNKSQGQKVNDVSKKAPQRENTPKQGNGNGNGNGKKKQDQKQSIIGIEDYETVYPVYNKPIQAPQAQQPDDGDWQTVGGKNKKQQQSNKKKQQNNKKQKHKQTKQTKQQPPTQSFPFIPGAEIEDSK